MACELPSTEPMPGDELVVLLKKLVQALDEEWHCHDGEWQLVAKILTHFGGTPRPGDTIPVLWQKIRIAVGDENCHCGDWEWNSVKRALDQFLTDSFRAGDSLYNIVLKFLQAVNNGGGGNPPVVLDAPVITQTDLNELSVAGTYFGAGGVQTILESSPDGVGSWVVFANVLTSADPMVFDISGEANAFWRARTLVGADLSPYSAVFEAYRPPAAFGNFPNDDFEAYNSGDLLGGLNGGENGNNGFTISWASEYAVSHYGATGPELEPDEISNLEVWIAADQISGLSDGDPLSTWLDLSGQGDNFTSAGANRPTYNTNVQNGLPGVHLTSTGLVGMASSNSISSGDFTIMVVFRSNGTSVGGRRVVQGGNNWLIGPYGDYPRVFNGGFIQAYHPTTDPVVITVRQTGTALLEIFAGGVLAASRTGGLIYPGTINLGAIGAFNEPAFSRIFEMAVYLRALTDAEIYGLSLNMTNKWGI